jgi:DNA transformation protein
MKMTPFLMFVMYDVLPESLNTEAKAMMGGYVLKSEGKTFAIVEDELLWLKGNEEVKEWYESRGAKQFSYLKLAPGGGERKVQKMHFYSVPEEVLEDKEQIDEWLDMAMSVATEPKRVK